MALITVGDLMHSEIKAITGETSALKAAQMMRDEKIGSLLIEQDGEYVGIITGTDIARMVVAEEARAEEVKVSSIMSSPLITIGRIRAPIGAADQMRSRGVRHLAVTDRGKIIGIISVRDLLAYFQEGGDPNLRAG